MNHSLLQLHSVYLFPSLYKQLLCYRNVPVHLLPLRLLQIYEPKPLAKHSVHILAKLFLRCKEQVILVFRFIVSINTRFNAVIYVKSQRLTMTVQLS